MSNSGSIRRVIRLRSLVSGRGGSGRMLALALLALLATPPDALGQAGRTTGLPLPRFVSLGADEVNLRFGPGEGYPIAWILTREGLPVEIVEEFDTWRKVCLHDGEVGWIHGSLLSSQRTVLVADEIRALRQTPEQNARIVLRAEPGVIGQLLDCDGNWCRVEIEGRRGWLQRAELWGVLRDGCGAGASKAATPIKDEHVEAMALSAAEGFKSFREEAERVTASIKCPRPEITPPSFGMGLLYGCIMGRAQTAKFWINEDSNRPGSVANVKVMWNDWFKDGDFLGHGVHADKEEAEAMAASLMRLYAPPLEAEVLDAFRSNQNTQFEYGAYRIEYRFTRGPKIDERLLIVTEK